MKKQLLFAVLCVAGIQLSAAASLTSGQINLLKAVPGKVIKGMTWNGQAIVPAGGSSASTVVNNGGASSASASSSASAPSMAQLQAAIANDPAGVAKAAMEALQGLGLDIAGARQPNSTAAAYIAS